MPLRFRILPPPAGPAAPAAEKGGEGARTFELAPDPLAVRIGRQPGSELELPFPSVSLAHARLFRGESPAEWWLEDLGSMNGTWLDGARLRPRRPISVRAGQRVRLATVEVVFEGWSAEARGDPSTTTIARRMISDLFGASEGDAAILTAEAGPAHPEQLLLRERDRRYVAGRAETCDLVLPSEHVSREHAVFMRRWDGVFVEDLGSRNGIKVNGQTTTGRTRLGDGDRVEVGVTTLKVTDPEDRYLRQLAAAADDVAPGLAPRLPTPVPIPSRARPATPAIGRATAADEPAPEPAPPRRATARTGALRPRPPAARPSGTHPRKPGRTIAMVVAAAALVLAGLGLIALFTKWG